MSATPRTHLSPMLLHTAGTVRPADQPAPHDAAAPGLHENSVQVADHPLILVVEDDVGMSTMLAIAIEDAGYTVQIAANGVEALDALEQIMPRLILLDLRMPVMDGLTFYHTAVARRGDTLPPIIVMTAYRDIDPEVVELGLASISKPMKLDVLIQMIRSYV